MTKVTLRYALMATAVCLTAVTCLAQPAVALVRQPAPPIPRFDGVTPDPDYLSSNLSSAEIAHDLLAPASMQALSPKDTEKLLKSTEGPNWKVDQVNAPACDKADTTAKKENGAKKTFCRPHHRCKKGHKKPKTKHHTSHVTSQCVTANTACADATRLAKKYNARISCSALYIQTTCALSTVNMRDPVLPHTNGK